jgi:hypothetical protein
MKMRKVSALILALLMSSSWLAVLPAGLPGADALSIQTFSTGTDNVTVVFPPAGGINDSVALRFPGRSSVTGASFNFTGGPSTPGGTQYPVNVTVDLFADSKSDWIFGGQGNGALGRQTGFANGATSVSTEFTTPGSVAPNMIRLPSDARVDRASFNITGGTKEYFTPLVTNGTVGEGLGYMVAALGDVNGDGMDDYGMGTYSYYYTQHTGHVYIYFGNANGTLKAKADVTLAAHQANDFYGASLAGAGDVNGDGYDDILVGAYYHDTPTDYYAGEAYIYYGGLTINSTPDIVFEGAAYDSEFGYSLDGIGDVNLDGYDDVIISAWYNDSGGYHRGAAYVYFGGAQMNNVSDIEIPGVTDYDHMGCWVAGAGDLNNDTHPDFAVGAENVDSHGAVYVFYGGSGLDAIPDVNITTTMTEYFGYFIAGVGDLNGDGYDDLAVQANLVEVWIFFGGKPMDITPDLTLLGETEWHNQFGVSWFGWGIDGLGDLDGDGYDDMMVGAFGYEADSSSYNRGKAYIYKGGPAMDAEADYTFTGAIDNETLGVSVAGIGDVNADGYNEFLIGAYMDMTANGNGKVYLESYSVGLLNPEVRVQETGAKLWNYTGIFRGAANSGDLTAVLNDQLSALLPSMIDIYATKFTNLTLELSTQTKGDFKLDAVDIRYNATFSFADLSPMLNTYTSKTAPGQDGYYTVPVRVKASTAGSVRLDTLNLVLDKCPLTVSGTASCSIPEGTRNATRLDLTALFTDDYTPVVNLTYLMGEYFENESYILLNITQNRYLSVDAVTRNSDPNWTGTTQVEVKARDAKGLVSDPVLIRVEVFNVDDQPLITSAPQSLAAMEGRKYTYDLNATDGDIGDVLSYYLAKGPNGMSMNSTSGLLSWIPTIADVGTPDISVGVTDGKYNVTQNFTLTVSAKVTAGNHLPVVLSEPVRTARAGATYVYQINASDEDGDALAYMFTTSPAGMELNRSSGKITWLPKVSDAGQYNISINISDGKDRIFHDFILTVCGTNPNHPPEILGTPPARIYAGSEFTFQFSFTDPDGDVPVFQLLSGPAGLQIDTVGRLIWTSGLNQVGTWKFTVGLTDGFISISKTFSLEVYLNHAPSFNSTSPTFEVKVAKNYTYKVVVSDIDIGDTTVVDLVRKPDGMLFNNVTGELFWTPTKDDVGSNDVSLRVTDGRSVSWQNFTITVPKPSTGGGGGTTAENQWLVPLLLTIIIAGVAGGVGYAIYRKRKKSLAERSLVIEDIFLVYRDGRLMSHHTRRLKPETDGEILTSMLTAIQDFVKQSIPTEGEIQKPVQEIAFGENKILIQHGKNVYIAAVVQGPSHERFKERMKEKVGDIEELYGRQLEHWNGELSAISDVKVIAKGLLSEGGETPEESYRPPESDATTPEPEEAPAPAPKPSPKKKNDEVPASKDEKEDTKKGDDKSDKDDEDDGDEGVEYEKVDIEKIGKEEMEPEDVDEKM